MPRPRIPTLSRARIIEAANELIDSEGLAELSMRKLGARLGVQSPSIYNWFTSKEDILDAVADAIIEQVNVSAFATEDWPTSLRLWGESYHDALVAHPNVVPILAKGPGRRHAGLVMADAVYGGLIRTGWPPARATQVGAAMRYFIVGSAMGFFALGFPSNEALYQERYPHLTQAHLLAQHHPVVDQRAFSLGLAALIRGLETDFEPYRDAALASKQGTA